MKRVCVIDIPGLSRDLLGYVPTDSALGRWIATREVAALTPSWPAVTCSVQATLTTGQPPSRHGIIANGIATYRSSEDRALVDDSNFASYRRDVSFWEQSNQFVEVPRFWQDASGKSRVKTAMLFFQHSMPGFGGVRRPAADIVLTPKPDHGPDGKLVSVCWSEPAELVPTLFRELGPFPLKNYWGPMAGIAASEWIARAAAMVWRTHEPGLELVYVPHLDYDLQRFGPGSAQARQAVVQMAAAMEGLVTAVLESAAELIVLSEYAISPVERSIQPNNLLRQAGMLMTRSTADGNIVDYEHSGAFVMVDHQIGHLYGRDAVSVAAASGILAQAGIEILDRTTTLDHRRAGSQLVQAPEGAWLDYRWWSDPAEAPVFAKMVDIHRKPGYDPLELFWDRSTNGISQDAALVRGSHGRVNEGGAVFVGRGNAATKLQASEVSRAIDELLG